ncbi:MAG: serine/threonine-protein kinase, partial [Planctomycetota bacterium]
MTKEDLLESIAEDFLKSIRQGKAAPSVDYYVRKCPQLEDDIRSLLRSLSKMEQFSSQETKKKKRIRAMVPANQFSGKSLGEFEIVREIGRGGMGTVFLAADRVLDRRVALKVLTLDKQNADARIERFRREAKLASRLHHTNIVPVFGVGQQENHFYYAMQFIDGVDLRRILSHLSSQEEPLDLSVSLVEQARRLVAFDLDAADLHASDDTQLISTAQSDDTVNSSVESSSDQLSSSITLSVGRNRHYYESIARIGCQVCDALQYAHSNGILHRDIKPSNLLMDRDGTVWVTDFGLAKHEKSDELTQSGDVLGTLRYMAPEQLEGGEAKHSDVYSLGLTLYELLTLKPAHQGASYRRLLEEKTLGKQPNPRSLVPEIPKDLETIVLKCISPDVKNRYRSANDMREDLERFLQDRPIRARRTTTIERSLRWCRRNKAVAALLLVIGLLTLTLPIGLGIAYQQEAKQRESAEQSLQIALDGLDEIFSSFVHHEDLESDFVSTGRSGASIRLSPQSGEFLQGMLKFYDKLAATDLNRASPRLRQESARAFRRVGDIHQSLGEYNAAIEAYEEAESRYAELDLNDDSLDIAQLHVQ